MTPYRLETRRYVRCHCITEVTTLCSQDTPHLLVTPQETPQASATYGPQEVPAPSPFTVTLFTDRMFTLTSFALLKTS